METELTIGQSIRKARGKVTLKELAERTGMSLTYLSDVQCDKTQPSIKSFLKIACALNVEPGRLLNYCAETREAFLQEHLDLCNDAVRGLQSECRRKAPIIGAAAELVWFIETLPEGENFLLNDNMQWARLRDYIHMECGRKRKPE